MHASDIMSTPVISVAPDTPVKDIAVLLFEKRIRVRFRQLSRWD